MLIKTNFCGGPHQSIRGGSGSLRPAPALTACTAPRQRDSTAVTGSGTMEIIFTSVTVETPGTVDPINILNFTSTKF